jgi:hypothetical protein
VLVPANLALRFLLELAALAAVSWWGWETGGSTAARLALAIVFPLAVAFVWGTFIAPKARVKVARPVWLVVQIAIFVVAAHALAVVWSPWLGIALLLLFVANLLLLLKLDSVP